MDVILAFVIFGFLGAMWMKKKGRSPVVGLLLGGFLNIIGMAVIFFVKSKNPIEVIGSEPQTTIGKPTYSGSRFAQDSGKGSVFHYASSSKGNELPQEFAIIDLETSGLEPGNARIIEIAILLKAII